MFYREHAYGEDIASIKTNEYAITTTVHKKPGEMRFPGGDISVVFHLWSKRQRIIVCHGDFFAGGAVMNVKKV